MDNHTCVPPRGELNTTRPADVAPLLLGSRLEDRGQSTAAHRDAAVVAIFPIVCRTASSREDINHDIMHVDLDLAIQSTYPNPP